MYDDILKALFRKKAGKAVPKLSRTRPGPLRPVRDGYYPKPDLIPKLNKKGKPSKVNILDPVQHEANQIKYVNTKGHKDVGEVNFIDDSNQTYYMNQRGPESNSTIQYANLNKKGVNNAKSNLVRDAKGKQQTKEGVDRKKFRTEDPIPRTDAHHIAGLDQFDWLFKGLDEKDSQKMIEMLRKRGVFTGDDLANRAQLGKETHNQLHVWMKQRGFDKGKASIAHLPLEERMESMNILIDEYKASMKQMYKLKMHEKYSEQMISIPDFHAAFEKSTRPELAGFAGYT